MAWKETCVMDERLRFIATHLEGDETFSDLCLEYGISRKTGYKWFGRYERDGVLGLEDRSRAPHTNPRALSGDIVEEILAVRHCHPSWGPRKVKAWLDAHKGDRASQAAADDVPRPRKLGPLGSTQDARLPRREDLTMPRHRRRLRS